MQTDPLRALPPLQPCTVRPLVSRGLARLAPARARNLFLMDGVLSRSMTLLQAVRDTTLTLLAATSVGAENRGCESAARLRWTPQLHAAFEKAVARLGGARMAQPHALRALLAPTKLLTLAQLKSHLQAYRRHTSC